MFSSWLQATKKVQSFFPFPSQKYTKEIFVFLIEHFGTYPFLFSKGDWETLAVVPRSLLLSPSHFSSKIWLMNWDGEKDVRGEGERKREGREERKRGRQRLRLQSPKIALKSPKARGEKYCSQRQKREESLHVPSLSPSLPLSPSRPIVPNILLPLSSIGSELSRPGPAAQPIYPQTKTGKGTDDLPYVGKHHLCLFKSDCFTYRYIRSNICAVLCTGTVL